MAAQADPDPDPTAGAPDSLTATHTNCIVISFSSPRLQSQWVEVSLFTLRETEEEENRYVCLSCKLLLSVTAFIRFFDLDFTHTNHNQRL